MNFHKFHINKQLFLNNIIFRNKYILNTNRQLMMPKYNKNYLQDLQKQRKKLKAQSNKYIPARILLQVIGNGNLTNPRCVILQTDHTTYLFNCGEGSQRLASEYHAKLGKLEHIFVTRATWNNIGGILGTALTVKGGVTDIKLHGPNGIIDIVEATKNFINLDELKLLPANLNEKFVDHTMTVTYVSVHNCLKPEENEYKNDLFLANKSDCNHEINSNGKRTHSCYSSMLLKNKNIDHVNQIDDLIIFICKIHDKVGTLNMDKCLEAGVTIGPDLGKLKSGIDLTLPNGQIVKSKDVVSKSETGPLFIVMECPNEDWINNIVENPVFLKHQAKTATDEDQIAKVIVHFTPENVLKNSKYTEWMHKFGTNTQHLIINEKNTDISSESIYKMQYQLNLIEPTIFPLFGYNDINQNKDKNVKLKNNHEENEIIIHRCKTLDSFFLKPFTGLDTTKNIEIHPKKYIDEAIAIDGFANAITALKKVINNKIESTEDLKKYPRLLMLGTGSSIPNKIRNTSGILLQLDEDRSLLLDCGEATLMQIFQFFGESKGYKVIKSIKAVYVSHLHADHHLGFIGILKLREQLTDESVLLLAPETISTFLNIYHSRFESIEHLYQLIPLRTLILDQPLLQNSLLQLVHKTLNISKISTVFVKHCSNAFAVAITLKNGQKICYSGDTMPCENVVKLAKNSFLLIHEATMEDNLKTEAIIKRHSTISEAIEIGEKAEVNFTLLTHFSQRYSKLPILPKNKNLDSVGISYDFMMISLFKINLLSSFYPALNLLFKKFQAELEERAIKREFKKERLRNT